MKLPTPKFLAKEDAKVQISEEIDENGALKVTKEFDVKSRLEQSNDVIYTKEGTKVSLRAKLFVFEKFDEFPDDAKGFCVVSNEKYDIAHTSKKRNPDSSVNHIVLELM